MREREATVGLDAEDDAARWLAQNDAPPPPATPKSLGKNKLLHQWRRRAIVSRPMSSRCGPRLTVETSDWRPK